MKINKADDFHKKNILKNYLDIIKTYVEIIKYKRHNHMLAEEFYKWVIYSIRNEKNGY
jgi:hypothetical protein